MLACGYQRHRFLHWYDQYYYVYIYPNLIKVAATNTNSYSKFCKLLLLITLWHIYLKCLNTPTYLLENNGLS